MQIIANTEEKLSMVYEALTTGLPYFAGYGLSLTYSRDQYREAREILNAQPNDGICIEDVQRQMLRMGYGLTFNDEEGSEEPVTLTLALIEANWEKVPMARIVPFVKEDYDADDADCLMQYLLFGEVVYG